MCDGFYFVWTQSANDATSLEVFFSVYVCLWYEPAFHDGQCCLLFCMSSRQNGLFCEKPEVICLCTEFPRFLQAWHLEKIEKWTCFPESDTLCSMCQHMALFECFGSISELVLLSGNDHGGFRKWIQSNREMWLCWNLIQTSVRPALHLLETDFCVFLLLLLAQKTCLIKFGQTVTHPILDNDLSKPHVWRTNPKWDVLQHNYQGTVQAGTKFISDVTGDKTSVQVKYSWLFLLMNHNDGCCNFTWNKHNNQAWKCNYFEKDKPNRQNISKGVPRKYVTKMRTIHSHAVVLHSHINMELRLYLWSYLLRICFTNVSQSFSTICHV